MACKKNEPDVSAIDLGYEYFPNISGKYIEYEVDSIHYSAENDTTHFFLREEYAEDFVDGEGQAAVRIERYKRTSADEPWILKDVWSQKRTTTTAERIEENQRFVRLVFPVSPDATWDGNAYNSMDTWEYEYQEITEPFEYEGLTFPNTLKVQQRNNINLVDQEEAYEYYAKGIGLVHKRLMDLNFQDQQITGVDMTMWMIDQGEFE
jgi:hypothetical protein